VIGVRLQGGPFDGDRAPSETLIGNPPGRIYAFPCPCCDGCNWFLEPTRAAEIYDRDDEDEKGWLVYVYTDAALDGGQCTEERELVGAGASTSTRDRGAA
jgi:hypothetical protein